MTMPTLLYLYSLFIIFFTSVLVPCDLVLFFFLVDLLATSSHIHFINLCIYVLSYLPVCLGMIWDCCRYVFGVHCCSKGLSNTFLWTPLLACPTFRTFMSLYLWIMMFKFKSQEIKPMISLVCVRRYPDSYAICIPKMHE